MKTFFVILIFLTSFNINPASVYICDSETATVYHKTKDCEGLQKCTHEIKLVTRSEAKNTYNRRACKICYFLGWF
jgi:hypothetical protein